jgi:hypothetical protein
VFAYHRGQIGKELAGRKLAALDPAQLFGELRER